MTSRFSLLLFFSLLMCLNVSAQKPCEWSENGVDSLGTYKALKDFIAYENNFGKSGSYIIFSLREESGMPYLNYKFIRKSPDFIPVKCFDKNSRLFLQLDNGKVVTLLHVDKDQCGSNLFDKDMNTLLVDGTFVFMKGGIEDLKSSPVSFFRVRYTTETIDYPMQSELKSELNGKTYHPQRFFTDYLSCVIP